MSMFTAPATSGGADVKPADLEGHLLVIEVAEFVPSVTTSYGEADAIRATVHDITTQDTYEDVLWFPKVLVGSLKARVGERVLAVMGKGTAKPGQSAPWVLTDATGEPELVAAATAYITGQAASSMKAPAADPVVEEIAEESGNPMLAAALGKLGAKRA